jgi:hypothetical protein
MNKLIAAVVTGLFSLSAFAAAHTAAPATKAEVKAEAEVEKAESKAEEKITKAKSDEKVEVTKADAKADKRNAKAHAKAHKKTAEAKMQAAAWLRAAHEKRLQLAGVEQRRPKSDRRQPFPSSI